MKELEEACDPSTDGAAASSVDEAEQEWEVDNEEGEEEPLGDEAVYADSQALAEKRGSPNGN